MKPAKFKPQRRLLNLLIGFACLVLGVELAPLFWPEQSDSLILFSIYFGIVIAVLILSDLAVSWRSLMIDVDREIPSNLALGKLVTVRLRFKSDRSYPFTLRIREALPEGFISDALERDVQLLPDQETRFEYQVKPSQRGEHRFERLDIQRSSMMGLWAIQYVSVHLNVCKVYPNFSAIAGYNLLHTDNQTIQLGIKKKVRRGEGMDFLQLREYREGDSIRQIDWKASSRYQKLISQEYQDARDQQVMVMLDSGRRMRTQDGELSHFDHSLNATLLLSHIALKQGDSVSVYSFGGDDRYVRPFKGAGNVQYLLNEVYDLYPSNEASDYLAAAQRVSVLNRKRSLIVIVSNLRDEDIDDLLVSVRLLQKKHLVLVANLYEEAIINERDKEISDFDSAIRYAGIVHYEQKSEAAMERLKAMGVWLINCTPSELSIRVVNSYLQIKNSAML